MVSEVYFNKIDGIYRTKAGHGFVSDGVPEPLVGSGDTDVDITKRMRKARS